jgi:hypothetical protein
LGEGQCGQVKRKKSIVGAENSPPLTVSVVPSSSCNLNLVKSVLPEPHCKKLCREKIPAELSADRPGKGTATSETALNPIDKDHATDVVSDC